MTNEEAINNLRLYCYGCDHSDECEECEIHIACNALEKQILTKPKQKMDGTLCPCCNGIVYYSNDYCDGCGQALDWGVKND